jgi:hypothetical protein
MNDNQGDEMNATAKKKTKAKAKSTKLYWVMDGDTNCDGPFTLDEAKAEAAAWLRENEAKPAWITKAVYKAVPAPVAFRKV